MRATTARANLFQSTHPVWDATPDKQSKTPRHAISIHASRMGCDHRRQHGRRRRTAISIHASRMGCDDNSNGRNDKCTNFNPRIPYGMRLGGRGGYTVIFGFQSTHPVWDATCHACLPASVWVFQSTHPVWDATKLLNCSRTVFVISIHASRMGCDTGSCRNSRCLWSNKRVQRHHQI